MVSAPPLEITLAAASPPEVTVSVPPERRMSAIDSPEFTTVPPLPTVAALTVPPA